MFPLEFWNKWYTIGKPLYRALWIRKKNWAWHHPMDGHAHLTEKASLLLKPVWSLPWQKSFQFQNCFQLPLFRAFFWGMSLFSRTTGLEMAGWQISKSEKHSGKYAFYYINHENSDFFSGLPDFKLCRPVISKPVDLGESYIHQKKALNSGNWK